MSRAPLVLLLGAAVSLVISAPEAFAQRGGAHAAIGGRGVFGGGARFGGGFTNSAGIGLSPSPTIPTLPSIPRTSGFGFRPGVVPFRGGFEHRPPVNTFRGGLRRPFHRGFAFGFGYPFGYGYPLLPLLGSYPLFDYGLPFDNGVYDNGYAMENYQQPSQSNMDELVANQAEMADQLRQLNAELNDLRAAQQSGTTSPPSPYVPPYVTAAPQQQSEPAEPQQPPITLVLRNGQQFEVRNYAVMNQTFWDFTSQPARKIPMSSIDIAASQKATQAKGGEFPPIAPAP